MFTKRYLPLVAGLLLFGSCEKKPDPIDINQKSVPSRPMLNSIAAEYMLESFEISGAKRISEPRQIVADSLEHALGGAAERYRYYHTVGIASAKYTISHDTIDFELTQLETVEDAVGFGYSLRPSGEEPVRLGLGAFTLGNSLYMIAAEYVATFSLMSDNPAGPMLAEPMAQELLTLFETKPPPGPFMFFPYSNQVASSAKYYTYDYLGVYGLNGAFTIDYPAKDDTVTFFMIPDTSGRKMERLRLLGESTGRIVNRPKRLHFDDSTGFAFEHPDLGLIVAGIKQKKIIGLVGYDPRKTETLMENWIKSLSISVNSKREN